MISLTVTPLHSVKEKTTGLVGADPVYPVYFETHFGIHTFGVLYPIDVVILDTKLTVVKIHESLAPNRLFFWNPRYSRVIELPEGTVKNTNISIGSAVSLRFTD